MKRIAVLTGAGMSAESGISTFRDSNGLWENHDVMEVASPQGWRKNRELVQRFYNDRRRQLKEVEPNAGHKGVAYLQDDYHVDVITQNVDDLHERAGSKNVLHLHGELRKVRSTLDPSLVYDWLDDVTENDKCERGAQLRPHIVWFGEQVPMLEPAADLVSQADAVVIIGTSMQVYPAASLVGYAYHNTPVFYIDPNPQISLELERRKNLTVIAEKATVGVSILVEKLQSLWIV